MIISDAIINGHESLASISLLKGFSVPTQKVLIALAFVAFHHSFSERFLVYFVTVESFGDWIAIIVQVLSVNQSEVLLALSANFFILKFFTISDNSFRALIISQVEAILAFQTNLEVALIIIGIDLAVLN